MLNRSAWLAWISVPLALILGYLLATPDDRMSFGVIGLVLVILCIPVFLRWHYLLLLLCWNAVLVPFFIPGRPELWALMAFVSLVISVLRRTIDKEATFLSAPSVARPLLFLGAVVLLTAQFTGGIGLAALGSSIYGGRKYFYIFAAIVGYFALTARSIPKQHAKFYTVLFFATGVTAAFGNLIYMAGSPFYFLFSIFPAEGAVGQAMAEQGVGESVVRIGGLSFGCFAIFCALLAGNGIRETFNLRKPWKIALLVLAVFVSLLGGFRSVFVICLLIFAWLFYVEGLHRTRLLPIFAIGMIFIAAIVFPFLTKLPFSVQRSLSVLPIPVDPVARLDAKGSSEWRIEMWKIVTPQIPQYFWKGKGYTIDPADLYMAEQGARLGVGGDSDVSIVAGDYHNGPLSLIIPFGIFGVIGFVWFLGGSIHALYRNFRYGDPDLQRCNAFLLAYFLAKSVFFFTVFGSVSSDLAIFVGLIGMSISLNGGVKEKKVEAQVQFKPENAVLSAA